MFRWQTDIAAGQRLLQSDWQAVLVTARDQRGPRRGTDRGIRVSLQEAHAGRRKAIDIRRADIWTAVARHIGIAKVVGHDVDDVGRFRRRLPEKPLNSRCKSDGSEGRASKQATTRHVKGCWHGRRLARVDNRLDPPTRRRETLPTMRNTLVIGVIVFGLCGAATLAQQGGAQAPPVPDLPTGTTAFWTNEDIQARWKDNEANKRINSRLFNGPTNISANVRIVLPGDPPATHETTADLWIVTAGTAIARTDGQIVDTNGTKSIRNGVQRTVNPGDILYVPPGVPHHFTDMKGFRAWLMRFDTIGLVRSKPEPLQAPGAAAAAPAGRGRGGAAAAPPVPDLPIYETAFWTNADIQKRWKDNEANKRINSRLYNGPANISGNVRIVLDGDAPATHEGTADLWLVTAGTAIARTDGEIVQSNGTSSIRNGVQRTVHPGDLLYVPPGVPHHFTDMKGFRALLIRYDVVGWAQSQPAAQGRGAQ